jgi:hypothetical protein
MSSGDRLQAPQVSGAFVGLRTRDLGLSAGITVFVAASHVVAVEEGAHGVIVKTTTSWYPVPYDADMVLRAVGLALEQRP